MEENKILKIAHGQMINNDIMTLIFLMGQRKTISMDVIEHKEELFKDPDKYKELMVDSINYINNQIKELLILE